MRKLVLLAMAAIIATVMAIPLAMAEEVKMYTSETNQDDFGGKIVLQDSQQLADLIAKDGGKVTCSITSQDFTMVYFEYAMVENRNGQKYVTITVEDKWITQFPLMVRFCPQYGKGFSIKIDRSRKLANKKELSVSGHYCASEVCMVAGAGWMLKLHDSQDLADWITANSSSKVMRCVVITDSKIVLGDTIANATDKQVIVCGDYFRYLRDGKHPLRIDFCSADGNDMLKSIIITGFCQLSK